MGSGQTSSNSVEAGWITRIGEASLRALAVALLASVPTALRTARSGGGFLDGLLIGAGVLVPFLACVILLAHSAGRGFRQFVGADSPRTAVLKLALWIGLALPLFTALGAGLKAVTHHRGLAGGTFGVLALIVAIASALIAHRLVDLGKRLVDKGMKPWIPAAIGAAIGVLPLLIIAIPLARRDGDADAPAVRAAVIDGAIVLVATALAATTDLAPLRRFARALGVPLAALALFGAAVRVESSAIQAQAFKRGGGLAATLLGALERWTDRDGDGMGAHFGGHDCDEGDANRRPGATEIAGDGVDQDCDGIDPPRALAAAEMETTKAETGPTIPANIKTAEQTRPAGPPSSTPDIVLVTLDTVRADHTSAYGYTETTTPNLAELAERGVLFEHAYATGSDTQHALTPIVSGKRLDDTARDKRAWPTLLPDNDTLAERLNRHGYRTAAVTSFTWLSIERGFSQGFDYWKPVFTQAHPEREVTGALAVKAAASLVRSLADDKHPFFLWVHLFDAHDRYLSHPGVRFGKGQMGLYDGEIAFVDAQLGELVRAVRESGREDRTAWIVHGSQGEGFGEHGFGGHGVELYDEVLRVPLVIALPGHKPGRYATSAVSTLDIAPTILEIAGAEADGVQGASLAAIARGDLAARRGPVYARTRRRAALIDWPLKLMIFERRKADRHLLFDLSADPYEKEDLARSREDDLARLVSAKSSFER